MLKRKGQKKKKNVDVALAEYQIEDVVKRVPNAKVLLETLDIELDSVWGERTFIDYLSREFPNFLKAMINGGTVKALHVNAYDYYQANDGVWGLLNALGYPQTLFNAKGTPKDPKAFYHADAHPFIEGVEALCLLQPDLLETSIAKQDYDGPGVSEAEHARQAGILAFYGLAPFQCDAEKRLHALRSLSGFLWHDIYRLVQPDRISAHSTHHQLGERMLHLFGHRVACVSKFHTAAKVMLTRTSVTTDLMTDESVESTPYQMTPSQIESYRKAFMKRPNMMAACYFAVTARLFGDDFAKLSRDDLAMSNEFSAAELSALSAVLIQESIKEHGINQSANTFIKHGLNDYFDEIYANKVYQYSNNPSLYENLGRYVISESVSEHVN